MKPRLLLLLLLERLLHQLRLPSRLLHMVLHQLWLLHLLLPCWRRCRCCASSMRQRLSLRKHARYADLQPTISSRHLPLQLAARRQRSFLLVAAGACDVPLHSCSIQRRACRCQVRCLPCGCGCRVGCVVCWQRWHCCHRLVCYWRMQWRRLVRHLPTQRGH